MFVVVDDSKPGMEGMEIGWVLLFFLFDYHQKSHSCALINWFVHDNECDLDMGMWTVQLECDQKGEPSVQVIPLETIACGAHLLPVYGSTRLPDDFSHHDTLDSFYSFFINLLIIMPMNSSLVCNNMFCSYNFGTLSRLAQVSWFLGFQVLGNLKTSGNQQKPGI
jgi:hypothetical protein